MFLFLFIFYIMFQSWISFYPLPNYIEFGFINTPLLSIHFPLTYRIKIGHLSKYKIWSFFLCIKSLEVSVYVTINIIWTNIHSWVCFDFTSGVDNTPFDGQVKGGGITVTYISVEGEVTSDRGYQLKVKSWLFILWGLFGLLKIYQCHQILSGRRNGDVIGGGGGVGEGGVGSKITEDQSGIWKHTGYVETNYHREGA